MGSRTVAADGDHREEVHIDRQNQGVDMISTLKLGNLWLDMLEAANLLGED